MLFCGKTSKEINMKKIFVAFVLMISVLCFASIGRAATANFGWTISPTNTDASTANVAGTVTKIYQSSSTPVTTAGTLIHTSLAGAVSANAVAVTAVCGATYYFAITTTADGNTSVISDTRSGAFACGTPGKPTLDTVIIFR